METEWVCPPHHKGCTAAVCTVSARKAAANRGKKRPDMTGPLHFNWKDGATPVAMKIRRSSEYAAWRRAVFERDAYTCQRCGATGYIEANHILPFATHPDERLNIDNGETLCKPCHRGGPKPRFREIPLRFSPEHRQNLSEAAKRRWLAPNKRPKRGPMSDETKARISVSKRGKPSWIKGRTKDTDPSVAVIAEKARIRMAGKNRPDSPS